MGFFDRLSRLLRANLNDLVNKAEDPVKILDQSVVSQIRKKVWFRRSGRNKHAPKNASSGREARTHVSLVLKLVHLRAHLRKKCPKKDNITVLVRVNDLCRTCPKPNYY